QENQRERLPALRHLGNEANPLNKGRVQPAQVYGGIALGVRIDLVVAVRTGQHEVGRIVGQRRRRLRIVHGIGTWSLRTGRQLASSMRGAKSHQPRQGWMSGVFLLSDERLLK